MLAWLFYGGFALAASAVMLALLLGTARQGNLRARQVILTMVWLLPTHLVMTGTALSSLLGREWLHPWWPMADWAALMFMAGLLGLALDDWSRTAHAHDDPALVRRLRDHAWVIYVPPVALLPLYLIWALAPDTPLGRLWFGPAGHEGALLAGVSAIYIALALWLWGAAAPQSPAARVWRRAVLIIVALHLFNEGLLPLLPGHDVPGWLTQVAAALPHAIVVLACAAGIAADGLIRPDLAQGIVSGLTVVSAVIVGVVGGGAVEPFVPAPWNTTLAAFSGVVLFTATLNALRAWLVAADADIPWSRQLEPPGELAPGDVPAAAGATGTPTVPSASMPSLDDLTPRQREVVLAALEGLSNAEIGERLCIAEVTVKKHLSAAFQKLGVSTRAQLIAAYSREAALRGYLQGSGSGTPSAPAPEGEAGLEELVQTDARTQPSPNHLGSPAVFD